LVYRGDMFLRGFDEEIRHFVKDELIKKGVNLRFNDNVSQIQKNKDTNSLLAYSVKLESGEQDQTGLVLYATGRTPHTQDLGLDQVNIALNKQGQIVVDEHFQTNEKSIFALGDVTGGMQLTPVALAEGMYLSNYLFSDTKPKPIDYSNIATAVFCQPTIGTVGLTEEQAKEQYQDVSVFVSNFKPMKHSLSGSDERCLMKMIVDKASDKVLGIHMVGAEAGEIIQGMAVAIKAGATKKVFDETIGIHPTSAEEFVTMRQARAD